MLDFSKDSNFFNVDEKIFLNRIGEGVELDEFFDKLSFAMTVSEDEDCIDIMQSLFSKVEELTVEEWDDLQNYLPLDVPVSDDDFFLDELENEII